VDVQDNNNKHAYAGVNDCTAFFSFFSSLSARILAAAASSVASFLLTASSLSARVMAAV
jgi:hypothetical protein